MSSDGLRLTLAALYTQRKNWVIDFIE